MRSACVALATALALAGCQSKPTPPRSVYVVLYDVSASVKPSSRSAYRQLTLSLWKQISSTAAPTERPARMVGALITGASLAHEQQIFDEVATDHGFADTSESKDAHDAKSAKSKRAIDEAAQSLMQRTAPGTEIMASLDYAQRVYAQFPQAEKHLVIFSDMIEQSDELDISKYAASFPEAEITRLVEKQVRQGFLPNLSGVSVSVCGATAATSASFRNFRRFWQAYFKAAKADLQPFNYGSTLNLEHL